MTTITIEGMEFYAPIGHFEEEQIIGTYFEVDLSFEVHTDNAEISDNLNDTVDYSRVYRIIKSIMTEKCNLLEHVCHKILTTITKEFNEIQSAKVKVSKLNPAMGGKINRVSVEKLFHI
ncbi:MAG: dihydroneopterin aldolase [Bacteroidetes bacterium]|nr:MAG: dihydroneopterin aldolase [Bacteroidota bacterium]